QRAAPEQFRPLFRPSLGQPYRRRLEVSIGTSPLQPLRSLGRRLHIGDTNCQQTAELCPKSPSVNRYSRLHSLACPLAVANATAFLSSSAGRLPSVTVRLFSLPARFRTKVTLSPGFLAAIALTTSLGSVIAILSSFRRTSSSSKPALAAGLFGITPWTMT